MLEHHYTAAQGTAADRPAKNRNEVLPAVYPAPEVSVCAFAPEKGFANTVLRKNESVYVDVDEAATAKEANIDKWQESADSKYF